MESAFDINPQYFSQTVPLLYLQARVSGKVLSAIDVGLSTKKGEHNPHYLFNVIPIDDILMEVIIPIMERFSINLHHWLAKRHSCVWWMIEECIYKWAIIFPKNMLGLYGFAVKIPRSG